MSVFDPEQLRSFIWEPSRVFMYFLWRRRVAEGFHFTGCFIHVITALLCIKWDITCFCSRGGPALFCLDFSDCHCFHFIIFTQKSNYLIISCILGVISFIQTYIFWKRGSVMHSWNWFTINFTNDFLSVCAWLPVPHVLLNCCILLPMRQK